MKALCWCWRWELWGLSAAFSSASCCFGGEAPSPRSSDGARHPPQHDSRDHRRPVHCATPLTLIVVIGGKAPGLESSGSRAPRLAELAPGQPVRFAYPAAVRAGRLTKTQAVEDGYRAFPMSAPQNIVAVIFDFDDTLTDDSTTKLLERYGIDPQDFWGNRMKQLTDAGWDSPLSYLKLILDNVGEGEAFSGTSPIKTFGTSAPPWTSTKESPNSSWTWKNSSSSTKFPGPPSSFTSSAAA